MSRIDLHNYEAFLLDWSEGTLSVKDQEALKAFVALHPELEINLGLSDLPYLEQESESLSFKADLFKNDISSKEEELLNYLEGNLSPSEKRNFENKCGQDAELASVLALYQKTKLSPDVTEKIGDLAFLYKSEHDRFISESALLYFEDQLSLGERAGFEVELASNKDLKAELDKLSKTKLPVDRELIYPNKQALKKEARVLALFLNRTPYQMAAALMLLIGLTVIYQWNRAEVSVSRLAAKKMTQGAETETAKNLAAQPKQAQVLEMKQAEHSKNSSHKPSINKNKIQQKPLVPSVTKETIVVVRTKNDTLQQKPVNTELAVEKNTVFNKIPEPKKDSVTTKSESLASLEVEVDYEGYENENTGHGFWKRAVQLAKEANRFGIKSVDAEENSKHQYRISFNSFSVEKK